MFSNATYLSSAIMRRLRGRWCTFRYGILGRHKIGKGLLVQGGLDIRGPGRVVIGDYVNCGSRVTMWTDDPAAEIVVGDHTFLNGTRFSCVDSVRIGSHCILADCRMLDSDYHSLDPDNREDIPDPKPITIEDKVWLTMGVIVTKGVTVGEGVTVTPGSVVTRDLEARTLYGGNPAKRIKSID